MATIAVFWLEPTDLVEVYLRRYEQTGCSGNALATCEARFDIAAQALRAEWVEDSEEAWGSEGRRKTHRARRELIADDDPRWPLYCGACGRSFSEDSAKQLWAEGLYAGAPGGALHTLRHAPAGSCYDAEWLNCMPHFTGGDGIALTVVTPGGLWQVDSEASNCTRKGDATHKCWIRHGDPRDPQGLRTGQKLHVDKNGDTCAAGAGSIMAGSYHGFLHHGQLTDC